MAGYVEALAELPFPLNLPFRIWLRLPEMGRAFVALFILYPIVAFLSVVTFFQILSYLVDMQPVQRYALRGLGIDTQNLIETSGVIDTVSLETFESDVPKTFNSIFIKRGQTVDIVAQSRSPRLRDEHPACLIRATSQPAEAAKIGTFVVNIASSDFKRTIDLPYSSDRLLRPVILAKDWHDDPTLKDFDNNDDVRVNIEYKKGNVYQIPGGAKNINEVDPGTEAGANPFLACNAFTYLMNIRIAKPELLLSN